MTLPAMYAKCKDGIYNDLVEEGLSTANAAMQAHARTANAVGVIEGVLDQLDSNKMVIKLRKTFSLAAIEKGIPKWSTYSDVVKGEVLEGLGFDTRHCHWNEGIGEYTGADGYRKSGRHIIGSERTDKKWIDTKLPSGEHCASDAAIDMYREANGLAF